MNLRKKILLYIMACSFLLSSTSTAFAQPNGDKIASQKTKVTIDEALSQTVKNHNEAIRDKGINVYSKGVEVNDIADIIDSMVNSGLRELEYRIPAERSPSGKSYRLVFKIPKLNSDDGRFRITAIARNESGKLLARRSFQLTDSAANDMVIFPQRAQELRDLIQDNHVSLLDSIYDLLVPRAHAMDKLELFNVSLMLWAITLIVPKKFKKLTSALYVVTFITAVTTALTPY